MLAGRKKFQVTNLDREISGIRNRVGGSTHLYGENQRNVAPT